MNNSVFIQTQARNTISVPLFIRRDTYLGAAMFIKTQSGTKFSAAMETLNLKIILGANTDAEELKFYQGVTTCLIVNT